MTASVIVTRPSKQAQPITEELRGLGYSVHNLPLMNIVPVPDNAEHALLRQQIQNLNEYQAVVVVSINAAEIGLHWLDQYWPQAPVGIDWIAVGPSTQEILENAGLQVHCPAESYDSEGMLELACLSESKIKDKKVLLWRGIGGRETLASTLRQRGAKVEYAELYQRLEIQYSHEEWQKALADKPYLMLSSTQALDIVCAQQPSLPEQITGLIVPAERTAKMAKERGFKQVLIAKSARDEDMLACLP
ncbi:MAG: uroporphyrinogen-III synthase [Venatoribacter sp.]